MRLTRVFVGQELREGGVVELPPETAAHVAKVLRARSGDELVLFCGDGRELAGEIKSVHGSRVTVALGRSAGVDRESPLAVTLLQCMPRGDRMDFIVQKATELGVRRIVPVLSQRSVVRLDAGQAEAKATHWRAVAVGACEQCGRNRLPTIDAPRKLIDYLGAEPPAATTRLVLEPDPVAQAGAWSPAAALEIGIGPEGGFTPDELDAFRVARFHRICLGPRILRAETAAIAALAWLQTRFGDMGAA
ncbi:MAG: 16S rRNA (uracil(1498)-N(3))-methyltransferase [Steroidobacterales bacterium]